MSRVLWKRVGDGALIYLGFVVVVVRPWFAVGHRRG